MKPLDWKNPLWRKRFWTVLTVLFVIVLASHPELRLLVPLLDAIGLDIFIALLGAQFTTFLYSTLKPLFYRAWSWLTPVARAADRVSSSNSLLQFARDFFRYALFNWVDYLGPQAWFQLHRLFRAARMGVN